jgi:hypothetical protein
MLIARLRNWNADPRFSLCHVHLALINPSKSISDKKCPHYLSMLVALFSKNSPSILSLIVQYVGIKRAASWRAKKLNEVGSREMV